MNATDTNTNDITISSSAVLVDLHIRTWTGRKMDKKVSAEIDADKHTQVRAGNYNKALLAGSIELDSIIKYSASVRTWLTQQTLPWNDAGTRLIPTARLFDFQAELGLREQEFNRLVNEFLDKYNTLVQAAQFRLGALFDADEYPDVETVAARFSMYYVFSPVPEVGDFRVDIGNEGLAELKKQYEASRNKYVQDAMNELWQRVRDVTERFSNQLRIDKNTGEKGRLYQATLDGALELCEMLKTMNLTGDAELERVRKDLFMTLNGVDLKELKRDDIVRADVKTELDALISKLTF